MSNGYIDLTGNTFHNGMIPGIGNSFNEKKAVFFIFSPRIIGDHFKRPLQYAFNNEIVHSLSECVNNAVFTNNGSGIRKISDLESAKRSILPSSSGIPMLFSKYDYLWTGILIVFNDEPNNNNVLINDMSNKLNNRVVYIGTFNDEPVNRLTLYQESPTLNLLAGFRITRKIVINKIRAYTHNGLREKEDLMSDIGVFHHNPLDVVDEDKRLYNLEPNNLINSTTINDKGEFTLIDLNGIGSNMMGSNCEKLDTVMQSPKKQMDAIFSSMLTGIEYAKYQGEDNQYQNGIFDVMDEVRENVKDTLTVNTSKFSDMIGIPSDATYQIQDIIRRYNPSIQPIIVPKSTQADIIPQNITSPNNVFSSLVSSCIPSYMTRAGISSLAFSYSSYHGAVQVYRIEAFDNSNNDILIAKWNIFLRIFKFELEPIIKASVGEFDLNIDSSINGSTYIQLNLMDFDLLPKNAVYEESSILGGLVSNSIGGVKTMFQNAAQLSGMTNIITNNFVSTGAINLEDNLGRSLEEEMNGW